jgi:hypothetical protein
VKPKSAPWHEVGHSTSSKSSSKLFEAALARDLGHEFRGEDVMRLWGWKALPLP